MLELKYYINALYLSFFSRKFYAELINNNKLLGARYLLILTFIVALPVSFEVKYIINMIFPSSESATSDENLDYIQKQIPEIKIVNGEFNIAAETNIEVTSKSGELVGIFDVENKVDDLTSYNEVIIVNKESVRIKLPNDAGTAVMMSNELAQTLQQYFNDNGKDKTFDTKRFFEDLKQVSRTPLLFIIIFSVIWFYMKYILATLAYSFVAGLFFTIICKKATFDFRQCFRVAVFTATPVALLEAISNSSGGTLFSHASLVYFVTHMIYIHFAVESYRKFTPVNIKVI
jgi:hypothetical protein